MPFDREAVTLLVLFALSGCSDEMAASSGSATQGAATSQGGAGQGGAGQGAAAQGGAGGIAGGGGSDGGSGGTVCQNSIATDEELPDTLSATGLYDNIADKTIAPGVLLFAPRYELWSDGAGKQRWAYLPECGVIDSGDMNEWSFPVGTRFWKEFTVGGLRIETRLIERVGEGAHDFLFTSYLWNESETEASRVPDGVVDARGTEHDVPAEALCRRCHGSHAKGGGRRSRALGFSALQLSDASPFSLADLDAAGQLTHSPDPGYEAPGNADESAALGYLHANCGNCHNVTADAVPQIDLNLWLDVEATDVAQTGAYITAVGVQNTLFNDQNVTARVEPGDAQHSAVWFRMSQRGNNAQMPPVGSEVADAAGLALVETWIASLP